ncbi:MAG: ABC transporter ATP-binding protein [Zhaonellaceae bacterium]
MTSVLKMKGIVKKFGAVTANDGVDFEVRQGEIHTLLGENGAGKTTLMNILYGLYTPDQGKIIVKGKEVQITTPKDALNLGIGMVHQHFMLVPPFTVAENVAIGLEGQNLLKIDLPSIEKKIKDLSGKYGLQVDPQAKVAQLSVGLQQRVEIIKVLYRGADILILDEPTAVLTPQEVNELFTVLRSITSKGGTVIFISHKLHEIMQISNRVTVLRNGKKVATVETKDTDERELARMMVGRDVILKYSKAPLVKKGPILTLKDINCKNDKGVDALKGINLTLEKGEILGIAGVDGNGQKELAEVIAGLRKPESGKVIIKDQIVTEQSPLDRIKLGLGYVPDDRRGTGLITNFPISYNLFLKSFDQEPFTRRGVLQGKTITAKSKSLIEKYQIKTPAETVPAANLSGGNQQKVVLAREISREPEVLVVSQPTRGLDVGAMEFIHQTLLEERSKGMGILLISSDLDEVLELSDRVLVMYEGQFVGEFVPNKISLEEIGLMMAGVTKAS